jgi:hypothetical protein
VRERERERERKEREESSDLSLSRPQFGRERRWKQMYQWIGSSVRVPA